MHVFLNVKHLIESHTLLIFKQYLLNRLKLTNKNTTNSLSKNNKYCKKKIKRNQIKKLNDLHISYTIFMPGAAQWCMTSNIFLFFFLLGH